MPFKKDDPNINRKGRTAKEEKPTPKQIKNKELMSLLRKLKPLMSKSIGIASKVIDSEDATESGKLKAAALLIKTYQDLVKEVYDDHPEGQEPTEVDQPKAPIFSLTVLKEEDSEQ